MGSWVVAWLALRCSTTAGGVPTDGVVDEVGGDASVDAGGCVATLAGAPACAAPDSPRCARPWSAVRFAACSPPRRHTEMPTASTSTAAAAVEYHHGRPIRRVLPIPARASRPDEPVTRPAVRRALTPGTTLSAAPSSKARIRELPASRPRASATMAEHDAQPWICAATCAVASSSYMPSSQAWTVPSSRCPSAVNSGINGSSDMWNASRDIGSLPCSGFALQRFICVRQAASGA